MASLYQQRVKTLMGWGLPQFEAKELAQHYITNKYGNRVQIGYTVGQMRSIAYLNNIVKARRLFVINQRNRLVPESEIVKKIKNIYSQKGYIVDGKLDVWGYLRDMRKQAIISGEYQIQGQSKGSHHPTKGNRGYSKYRDKAKEQRRKLSTAKKSASQMGDVNSWIKELESKRKIALDKGNSTEVEQINRQINNLRKSKR